MYIWECAHMSWCVHTRMACICTHVQVSCKTLVVTDEVPVASSTGAGTRLLGPPLHRLTLCLHYPRLRGEDLLPGLARALGR